jgi:helicase
VAGESAREHGFAWLKITDPEAPLPYVPSGADLRVLLPDDEQFTVLAEKITGAGGQVRRIRYLVEDEVVSSEPTLTAVSRACRLNRPDRGTHLEVTGIGAAAARDAFDVMWDAHVATVGRDQPVVQAAEIVPAELARFLPFGSLNPAQAQALPEVLGHEENLMVVAPTGAGKTVIGMVAALRAVVQQGRKAAWLVPQRSLTDELDSELAGWRRGGLRVERLSGEQAVDIDRIRDADMWVATTEKFEAICRASAFRESLTGVGALIVDEVHLLGDPTRGPVLEALLARLRDGKTGTRIVGLSATVSNAQQVAGWLRARLVRCDWRPSRLTWQLPTVPAHSDFAVTDAARTRLAAAITGVVAADGGSVLVFCGSKRNVRRTALVIAASRGVDVSRVRPDDLERLQMVCRQARIGLHYQGWEHRREAERAFRERELDVLVATTTVAAGVNLPARAVIVQDAEAGFDALDVATVQQMFGRAGRIGAGEYEGWAFLIVDERERATWQSKLVVGHTVRSRIRDSLPEHVLSEAVQQRIGTQQEAEDWWVQTLAYHQGLHSVRPLRKSVAFLRSADMLTSDQARDSRLVPTSLGRLTARLMVEPEVCDRLRATLNGQPVPAGPEQAEAILAEVLAALVPKLVQARVGEDGKSALAEMLANYGQVRRVRSLATLTESGGGQQRGELARAALLTVSRSPDLFRPGVRRIGGIPYGAMYPILEGAPRYLHWIACQGFFGTIHPWCAIVAADLELRITWRMLRPPRGAGRLLWACEHMAAPANAAQAVPQLWAAARARAHTSPDWPVGGRPAQCHLDDAEYLAFLRDRATGVSFEAAEGSVQADGPPGSVLVVWSGPAYRSTAIKRGYAIAESPGSAPGEPGAAVFTWRGDYRANGWLAAYSQIAD